MISFPTKSVVATETLAGFFFFFHLYSSVNFMSFSKFRGKFSPNFPCHRIEKKNHDAGSEHSVGDGN